MEVISGKVHGSVFLYFDSDWFFVEDMVESKILRLSQLRMVMMIRVLQDCRNSDHLQVGSLGASFGQSLVVDTLFMFIREFLRKDGIPFPKCLIAL